MAIQAKKWEKTKKPKNLLERIETLTETNNIFDEHFRRLDTPEKKPSKLEGKSIESVNA